MSSALFTLDQVRFRDVLSIEHLEIPADEVTCIVGRSGSGKSTLMRLLNRMISPDAGTITYRGESIDQINAVELRRRVVMLPQNPVLFEGSIGENVQKGLEFSQRPFIDDSHLQRLLDLMQIRQSSESRASVLSGGERQRVALARVLAMQPDVLLLDEPSSALDHTTQSEVIGAIVAEAKRCGSTLIMVTHARDIAREWGDVMVEIEAGRISTTSVGAHHG